jgi:hypothetical protein
MRNMSFALTEQQILARTKDVTRRMGWDFLKPGDLIQPVRKGMGLKKGEKAVKLCPPLRIVSRTPERLNRLIQDVDYGFREVEREGFKDHPQLRWPSAWVEWFAASHRCGTAVIVSRIEFEYTEPA